MPVICKMIGSLMATLPDIQHYGVSIGTGWPGVCIQ